MSDEIGAKLFECLPETSTSYAGFNAAIEYETFVFCGVKKSYPYPVPYYDIHAYIVYTHQYHVLSI